MTTIKPLPVMIACVLVIIFSFGAALSKRAIAAQVPAPIVAAGNTQSLALTAAGTNQATALALTSKYNEFTTVAAIAGGAKLPVPLPGDTPTVVVNAGANPLNVFPPTGVSIDSYAANAAVIISVGDTATFKPYSATKWYSNIVSQGCVGVTVTPTIGIQNAVNANPPGTTFCLAPGTYNEQVVPLASDKFIGTTTASTILDGTTGSLATAFTGDTGTHAGNVEIRRLTIQNYTTYGIKMGSFGPNENGWIIDLVQVDKITNGSSTGVGIFLSSRATLTNSVVAHSCLNGITGVGRLPEPGSYVLIENNDIAFNNACNVLDAGGSYGGWKTTPGWNWTIMNNAIHDQQIGVWFDSGSGNVNIVGNEVYNCVAGHSSTGAAIVLEIMAVPTASDTGSRVNNITGNYIHDCPGMGINIANSGYTNIIGNAFSNVGPVTSATAPAGGVTFFDEGSRAGWGGIEPYNCDISGFGCLIQKITFMGNYLAGGSTGKMLYQGVDQGTTGANWKGNGNTYDYNTFYIFSSSTASFAEFTAGAWTTNYTFATWQAHGLETHSTATFGTGTLPGGLVSPGFNCPSGMTCY